METIEIDKYICPICNKEFEKLDSLSYHAKSHKLKVGEYFQKYFPRLDLYSREPIAFKDKNLYFSSFFNDRKNMVKYFLEKRSDYLNTIYQLFESRVKIKNLKYAPSEVELKTSMLPSVKLLETIGIDYNEIINHFKLIKKFDYAFNNFQNEFFHDLKIIIDTREQYPLQFDCETISNKLDFGDYVAAKDFYSGVFVERKSLSDFISTVSGGYLRFNDEIARAQEMESYIIVVIESKLGQFVNFNKLPEIKNTKAKPEFILHRAKEMMQKYNNLQFLFVEDRREASKYIQKIFVNKENSKKIDWQYTYDCKKC